MYTSDISEQIQLGNTQYLSKSMTVPPTQQLLLHNINNMPHFVRPLSPTTGSTSSSSSSSRSRSRCRLPVSQALLLLALLLQVLVRKTHAVVTEPERVAEYDKRYPRRWPPAPYVPNNEGWKRTFEKRFAQINQIHEYNERYEGYV